MAGPLPFAGLRASFDRALRMVKEYNEKVEYIHHEIPIMLVTFLLAVNAL